MDNLLEIRLLGGLSITYNGTLVKGFASRKAEALLIYLACNQWSHPRDILADLLWDDRSQAQAMANLRVLLTSLRQRVASHVEITRQTVAFNTESNYWIDSILLQETMAAVTEQSGGTNRLSPEMATNLAEVLELYQGDFLAGFNLRDAMGFEEWVRVEQERIQRQVLKALNSLVIYGVENREYERGIAWGEQLLQLDSLHEETYRQVMMMLALNGQRQAALLQYDRCIQVLKDELDVPPADETVELYDKIRTGAFTQETQSVQPQIKFEVVSAEPTPRHNLSHQLTPIIGREVELNQILQRLNRDDCRLLTLMGPGGVGKTRLSLEAAHQIIDQFDETGSFPHGVYFVALAPVNSLIALTSAIADAIQFSFQGPDDPKDQLLNYLRQKEMLLVMDNMEHLMECADFLIDLLSTAPNVKMLLTSRERLNARGEWLLEVEGLSCPDEDDLADGTDLHTYPAMQMFLESARYTRPDFSLKEDPQAIVQICRQVEGLPLGIQLAAAAIRVFSCQEIADEIQENLDFIATSMRDIPGRHRSLRAVFEHSWELLNPIEQKAFQQLAVFEGGFASQAALRVAKITPLILTSLIDKSLLQRVDGAGGPSSSVRYKMHDILHQYAVEKLSLNDALDDSTRKQHSSYYLKFIQEQGSALIGTGAARALAIVGTDIKNIRSAWDWAVQQNSLDEIAHSMQGLSWYYLLRGPFQAGEGALTAAIGQIHKQQQINPLIGSNMQVTLGRLLVKQANFLNESAVYNRAVEAIEEAIGLAQANGLADVEAEAYLHRGHALRYQLQQDEARICFDKALDIARSSAFHEIEADGMREIGHLYWSESNYAEAKSHYDKALLLYRQIGHRRGELRALTLLGTAALYLGNYTEAETYNRDALGINRELGDRQGEGVALNNQGFVFQYMGDYAKASSFYEDALRIRQELGDRYGESLALMNLGTVYFRVGNHAKAQRYYEDSLRIQREIGNRIHESRTLSNLGLLFHHLGRTDEARRYSEQGLQVAKESRAIDNEGYALTCLGHALVGAENWTQAIETYEQALAVWRSLGEDQHPLIEPQAGLARIYLAQDDPVKALIQTGEILERLETDIHRGVVEPFRVCFTCYRILDANDDQRAIFLLNESYRMLQEQAQKISDVELRRSFLYNVPVHKAIVKEYAKQGGMGQ